MVTTNYSSVGLRSPVDVLIKLNSVAYLIHLERHLNPDLPDSEDVKKYNVIC